VPIALAAHCAGEHHFADRPGVPYPIRIAAGADQVAPPVEIERIYRQRDGPAALSPTDFEDIKVAANQPDPD
jgi:hypothetical protein